VILVMIDDDEDNVDVSNSYYEPNDNQNQMWTHSCLEIEQ
jgi:hypothetical protein